MKRSTIRQLGRFLPRVVRQAAKRRFLGDSIQEVESHFVVEESGAALVCRVNGDFSFSAPLAARHDLAHYTTSLEGRAEFAALAEAALNPGGVLFDIGAHCGIVSTLWCAARPENRVCAFEPSPALSRRLAEIRDLNQVGDRMQLNQVGIGEVAGRVSMVMDPVSGFVQSTHFQNTMWGDPEGIEVPIETIESAAAGSAKVPHFIKLDIEGYEYEAIKGSVDFLARHRPRIFLELHLNYLEERGIAPRTVLELLQGAGYSFFTYAGAPLPPGEIFESPLAIYHLVAR